SQEITSSGAGPITRVAPYASCRVPRIRHATTSPRFAGSPHGHGVPHAVARNFAGFGRRDAEGIAKRAVASGALLQNRPQRIDELSREAGRVYPATPAPRRTAVARGHVQP